MGKRKHGEGWTERRGDRWRARYWRDGKKVTIATCDTEEEADAVLLVYAEGLTKESPLAGETLASWSRKWLDERELDGVHRSVPKDRHAFKRVTGAAIAQLPLAAITPRDVREWVAAQEPIPQRVIEIEKDRCDQPSCANPAVGRFKLKKLFSAQGEAIDAADTYGSRYRQFCRVHLRRGDCSREDADANYEPLDGVGPDQSSNVIESPAACMVVGPTDLENLPAALQAAVGKPSA